MINRNTQISEISYLLIGKRTKHQLLFDSPEEFRNIALDVVSKCPVDIMQLTAPLEYLSARIQPEINSSMNFRFVYSEDALNFIKSLEYPDRIYLFFLDFDLKENNDVIEFFEKFKNPIWYYFNLSDTPYTGSLVHREVDSVVQFIGALIKDQDIIAKKLSVSDLKLAPSIPVHLSVFNFGNHFDPARVNTKILCDIFGNYGHIPNYSKEEEVKLKNDILTEAVKNMDTFDRFHSMLDIVETNDNFILELVKQKVKPLYTPHDPLLSPLILVAPFHSPEFTKMRREAKKDKESEEVIKMLGMLTAEQTNNYTLTMDVAEMPRFLQLAGALIKRKSSFLDNVAYLHSTFTFSPVIRLPLKGRSLNRELSFFKIENHTKLNSIQYRRRLHKTIARVGSKLAESLFSDRMKSFLKERNRQLVLISDLPLEWARIDGVPLAFSHDTCRIPETAHASIMAQYMSNSIGSLEIGSNILDYTLIISGSKEESFTKWQRIGEETNPELIGKFKRCYSIDDVCNTLKAHKPLFVIFDCHGGVDSDNGETYLLIGDEKLTPEIIVSREITVPLIFLSACGTSPSYGLFNSVANAFFQMGSFSVTGTYLPVLIDSGSLLYLRIMRLLKEASNKPIHSNWLAFISHVIRTSSIHESFKGSAKGKDQKYISATLAKSMDFNNRHNLYHELDEIIAADSEKVGNRFSQGVPEYLFYTNLGRSDLIYFKSWKNAVSKGIRE